MKLIEFSQIKYTLYSEIIPSGIETWEAFKVIAENVAKMP